MKTDLTEEMTCKNCENYNGDYCTIKSAVGGSGYLKTTSGQTCADFEKSAEVGYNECIDLKELHKVYKTELYIEDTKRIDIVLATALSNKLEGIPIWLILVGASGDLKSVQLNAIRGKDVYLLHNLTSKTLVNGYKNKKDHPDLAPKLNTKIIVIPDMAQILKLPPVEKGELWGQLRDLYDGFAGKESGQGASSKYENLKTTLLAGSTPSIDAQILVHQDLGTRELVYRTSGNKNKEKLMDKCFENEESEAEITQRLKEVTMNFLNNRDIKRSHINPEILAEIKKIAIYISYMRATAEFDGYTNELRNAVYPEEPTRIAKQLKRLFICLMSLSDDYSEERALEILWHVGKSSAFPIRTRIFEFLKSQDEREEFSTSELSEKVGVGKSTIKRECSVLENVKLISCRRQETTYPDKFYEYWKINKNHKLLNPSKHIVLTMMNDKGSSNTSIISMDTSKVKTKVVKI